MGWSACGIAGVVALTSRHARGIVADCCQVRRCGMLKAAMPVDVMTAIVIKRPVSEVSAYAADPDNAPSWYENIKSVEWRTPRPVQVGSRIDFVAQFLGRRLAYTYEVIEYVPGKRLTMRTPGPPFLMETTYTWEIENGGTRMTLRNRGTPSGFLAWLAPLMSFMVRRATKKDLALLKRRLETQRPA